MTTRDYKRYVVGLMFGDKMDQLVLIHKRRGPECVVGKWNGVGGHIDPGEVPEESMPREFYEETGVMTVVHNWTKFCTLANGVHLVYFYYGSSDGAIANVETVTDEPIHVFPTFSLPTMVPNLYWMIPFIQDKFMVHDLGTVCQKNDTEIWKEVENAGD